jgi:hypothetical protein
MTGLIFNAPAIVADSLDNLHIYDSLNGYLLCISFFLAVDDIDKRTVFQVDLVLLDVLADGVAGLLVGILNSLHSPLSKAVAITAGIHVHVAVERSACHIFGGFPE